MGFISRSTGIIRRFGENYCLLLQGDWVWSSWMQPPPLEQTFTTPCAKPNQTANESPRDAVRRHYQGVRCSQKVHTVSRQTHKCQPIIAPKYSTALLTPISTTPKTSQQHSVRSFRTKYHPKRSPKFKMYM